MNRSLKVYIAGLVAACALALAITSLAIPVDELIRLRVFDDVPTDIIAGIIFWTVVALLASAMPVEMPRGTIVSTSIAPLVVALSLGGPAAAGWVALIGTTELRELRREIPWYGTLANHAGLALPAMLGGLVSSEVGALGATPAMGFVATLAGAAVFFACNVALTAMLLSLRRGQSIVRVIRSDMPTYVGTF
ncbi:MAG TPA: hypothetical protein VLM76_04080, partial [Patescibacteria group bacterium]|nr:hypothetical protein [Patescibacteria group bacterium]